jgi:hypothetical protein
MRVSALLSNRGASHRLLRMVGVPLVLEYEHTLKRVCTGGSLTDSDVDSIISFICADRI